jgi:hypothetical protein
MLMNANANRTRQQRQFWVLGLLIAALVVIVAFQLLPEGNSSASPRDPRTSRAAATAAAIDPAAARPGTPARSGSGGTRAGRAATAAGAAAGAGVVEEVNLAKLKQPEPEPIEGHRNPFSLAPEPKPAAAASAKPTTPVAPTEAPIATGPPPVPPPPPITLKFFGVITGGGRVGKVAALGDGKFVYHGREGEIIEGKYRIVKIGEESIQLEYVDGRGRQTIRLSGK